MRRLVRAMVAAGTISTAVVAAGAPQASAGAVCDASFHVIASPSFASADTQLSNVAAWNTHNAWAIGDGTDGPFSMHWDGIGWKAATIPTIGQETLPFAIAMAGPHDVWTFGEYKDSNGKFRSLALHKTGGPWAVVPTPNLGTGENDLFTVSVGGPKDIWAAGNGTVGGVAEVLVLHWNGIRWKRVAQPPAIGTGNNSLEGMTTDAPGEAWLALTYPDAHTGKVRATTFHRSGSVWQRVNFHQPSPDGVEPRDIMALSPTLIWMVGFADVGTDEVPMIERYNGTHWVASASANPGPDTFLEHIAALGPHVVYAVGGTGAGTFVERYDGTSWKQVATHDPAGASSSGLFGAAAGQSGPHDVRIWGVGYTQQPAAPRQTLVEQSCIDPAAQP